MTAAPPPYQQQYPAPPVPPAGPAARPRGGLATASLVLGIIGLVLAVIPFVNFAAYPLVILAIVFGAVSFGWGKAKAGAILGVVGLLATIVWSVSIGKVFNDATNAAHTVVYKVSGSGKADVHYYTSDGSSHSDDKEVSATTLPWTATVKVKGDFSGFSLSANPPDFTATKMSCQILVDGKVASSSTSDSATGVTCFATGYDGK